MATQPAPDPTLLALVAAYQAQSVNLRDRLERYVRTTWRALGMYRNVQQATYAREVAPVIAGAQQQMVAMTSAYVGHQRQIALGTPFKPVPVDPKRVTGQAARLGANPLDVHARPFNLVWRQLDELPKVPESIPKAITSGENRAVSLALDDVQLAKNHTAGEIAKADDKIRYVRRVLEGPSSCGLCIVASTQRYHRWKLMPIHGGCDCSHEFVYGEGGDPGPIIDLDTLQGIHDRIEQRFGTSSPSARRIPGASANGTALSYRDVLVTHAHGELGDVLSVKGEHFTGPSALA